MQTHTLAIPAFGVTGSSWATSFARLYLMASSSSPSGVPTATTTTASSPASAARFSVLVFAVWRADRNHHYGLLAGLRQRGSLVSGPRTSWLRRIEYQHLRRLFLLGAPAGASIFVEIAIFALVTTLIATFGRLSLAGHEVALQCASTTFMVPFAISAATSVRVGHAIGRMRIGLGTTANVIAAGWSGIGTGAAFMLCASVLLLTIPTHIARLFTPDPGVIAAAVPLLLIAAGFQFFDGVQITATGALRGAGNTHAPFITQLIAYWVIGMPLGILLGFHEKLGAAGLWWGLLIALTCGAFAMCYFWRRTTLTLTT